MEPDMCTQKFSSLVSLTMLFAIVIVLLASPAMTAAQQPYHVIDRSSLATLATIPVGTNPDGIAFEPATQTVWAFNGRSKDVSVIDASTRKVVATIPLPGKPEFPAVDGNGTVFDNIEDKSEIVRLDAHARK